MEAVEQGAGAEEDLAGVVGAWGAGAIAAAAAPATGTVNRTVLLTTARGRFALRGYRPGARPGRPRARPDRLRRRPGVPAVAPLPLPLPGGGTVIERGGRFFALFPWAAGRQVARADVGGAEAAAMGEALGRLHLALRGFPPTGLPRRSEPEGPTGGTPWRGWTAWRTCSGPRCRPIPSPRWPWPA